MYEEEEERIKKVMNFPIHAFQDLTTPARLFQCGFDLDPAGNASTPLLSLFLPLFSVDLEFVFVQR